ncbi:MAG: toxin-antitoxin system HicB family antitoxin [Chthonomonadales bacterium]
MSALSIRIPNSLHDELRDIAEKEGVSINQLALSALAEKVAVLRNSDRYNPNLVRERAGKGYRADYVKALDGVPDVPAEDRNKI